MRITIKRLEVVAKKTTEAVVFSSVTFIHGPVGTGKSTVARLIDFCFGGDLVDTPAIQTEFVSARLFARIGQHDVVVERDRGASDARVTWTLEPKPTSPKGAGLANGGAPAQPSLPTPAGTAPAPPVAPSSVEAASVLAPLQADRGSLLIDGVPDVENLSDLIFHLAGIQPIRVRQSKKDPDAKLIRLSFRDLLFYCYLDQDEFDSSFFAFEHPFKRNKSIDALHFIVGFHSERMNELEQRLYRAQEDQRAKRAAVTQLERLLKDLEIDNDIEFAIRLEKLATERSKLQKELAAVEESRKAQTHPLDALRGRLRELNAQLASEEESLARLEDKLSKREALKAELVTGKLKALRAEAAERVIGQVAFLTCPQCETPTSADRHPKGHCSLCGEVPKEPNAYEDLAADFDARIDDVDDLLGRQRRELKLQGTRVREMRETKRSLDAELEQKERTYDAAFIARLRELERTSAELEEREKNLKHLRRIPASLERLVREAGELQGEIDVARKAVDQERLRLRSAQTVVQTLQARFKAMLLRVGFPGMAETHNVAIDMTRWEPQVFSGEAAWGFGELGSGGKKVLFKALYALSLHELAAETGLPLPTFLIIDSPTKNISHDVNPELFEAFYKEVYRVAELRPDYQFILIDSELVMPPSSLAAFTQRLLSHTDEHPPLISYYRGL